MFMYCDNVFFRRRNLRRSLTAAEAQRCYSRSRAIINARMWAPGTRERATLSDFQNTTIITRFSDRERRRHREPATQPRDRQRREGFGAGRWNKGRARGITKSRDTVTVKINNIFDEYRNRVDSKGTQSIGAQ